MSKIHKRAEIAEHIVEKLQSSESILQDQFNAPGQISSFYVDDLLPLELANDISNAFPAPETLSLRSSLREKKYVGVQLDRYNPLITEAIMAFQDLSVVETVGNITGIQDLQPDKHLYAGGISMMGQGHFLMPHLDNSHDKNRQLFRVLNLLYYVSKDWHDDFGGNLELWDRGPTFSQRTIHSRFNRLVVMVTNKKSWHSVSRVVHNGVRCCVSNYYFSSVPSDGDGTFHVTTFRAYPHSNIRNVILKGDSAMRSLARKIIKKQTTFQVYDPDGKTD